MGHTSSIDELWCEDLYYHHMGEPRYHTHVYIGIYIDGVGRNLFFRNNVDEYINSKVVLCILFVFSSVKLDGGLDHAKSYMDRLKTNCIDHSRRFMHMFMFMFMFMLNNNIKNNSQFYQHFPNVFVEFSYTFPIEKIDGNGLGSK